MYGPINAFLHNITFWSAFLAWLTAQLAKVLCDLATHRHVHYKWFASTGGMPSAHSAMVGGLAFAVAWQCGLASPLFGVAIAFAILTMFDAATVRRAAGLQARILNTMIDELFHEHHLSQQRLKELLGHTRLEVLLGFIIGVEVGAIVNGYLG